MRFLAMVIAAIILTALLGASVGQCAVPGEIVLWGDDKDKPASNAKDYNPTMAEIKADGVVFFVIRTPAIGYTVAERETIVLKRLIEVYSTGKIAPVFVSYVRGKPTIYVDKIRLITVYPVDVVAAGAPSARALAEHWADGIRAALQITAPSNCFGGPPVYVVAIGGRLFFRLSDPGGFSNVRERGRDIDAKLALIVEDFEPELVGTMPVPEGVAVTFKGEPVVIATPADARARGAKSPKELAAAWAKNLCEVMPIVKTGCLPAPAAAPEAKMAPVAGDNTAEDAPKQ